MKLTTTTNVSVDGVMQGLGGTDEGRRGGLSWRWALPLVDAETEDYLNEVYGHAATFFFGRRTFEIVARSWGATPDTTIPPIGVGLQQPRKVPGLEQSDRPTVVGHHRPGWRPRCRNR